MLELLQNVGEAHDLILKWLSIGRGGEDDTEHRGIQLWLE